MIFLIHIFTIKTLIVQYIMINLINYLNKNLKILPTLENKLAFLNFEFKRFKKIGEGKSRNVFAINNIFCIKIAKNYNGIQQNKTEINISTNIKNQILLSKVFYYDQIEYTYEIMKIYNKVNDLMFEKLWKFKLFDLICLLDNFSSSKYSTKNMLKNLNLLFLHEMQNPALNFQIFHTVYEFFVAIQHSPSNSNLHNLLSLFTMIKENIHIDYSEFNSSRNWGIDTDNTLKIIDYGLTQSQLTTNNINYKSLLNL